MIHLGFINSKSVNSYQDKFVKDKSYNCACLLDVTLACDGKQIDAQLDHNHKNVHQQNQFKY